MLGVEIDPRLHGHDLLAGPVPAAERFGIVNSPVAPERHKLSLARDGFQLIHRPDSRRDELYDLTRDPLALRDIADEPEHRGRVAALRGRALEIRRGDRLSLRDLPARPTPSEEELEKLRALGYLE